MDEQHWLFPMVRSIMSALNTVRLPDRAVRLDRNHFLGKLRVSRNALRHGLAAATLVIRGSRSQADRLATAIAGEHADAAQREQALIIAESELTLLPCGPTYSNRRYSRPPPKRVETKR
jgi:hypothetical protein